MQSGYESMFSMLNACLHNVNLIVHSAGMLDSYAATSYEQFMVDLEIISMIEFYYAKFHMSFAAGKARMKLQLIP